MKQPYGFVLLGGLLLGFAESEASGGGKMPLDPRYISECGECHAPYPARLLPASSWRSILSGLEHHFESDASLDPATAAWILAYLEAGARRESDPPPPQPLIRITESRWFRHEHGEVPQRVWQSLDSPSNCEACHANAGKGNFAEHDIHLPTPR